MTSPRFSGDMAADALEVLIGLAESLRDHTVLEEALPAVAAAMLALLPGNHTSVRLLDEPRDQLLVGARGGVGAFVAPMVLDRGQGLIGWVVEHGEALLVPDTLKDPRFKVPKSGDQGFEVRSVVAVPLLAGGQAVGVLSASSPDVDAFSPAHLELAWLLANSSVPLIQRSRLERLAVTDHLTRAFNPRSLEPMLSREQERARRGGLPLSVLLLDLDHFKAVNDELGHAAGDLILRGFADRVRATVRRLDVLIRSGGEEFVLLMPGADAKMAVVVAGRVRRAMADDPFDLESRVRRQTVSIGAAQWDGEETGPALLHRADLAMYDAKHAGRDQVKLAGG